MEDKTFVAEAPQVVTGLKTKEYTLRAQRAYVRRNIEAKRFHCAECDIAFPSSKDLNRHLESRKHVPQEAKQPVIHSCEHCGYSTTYKWNLHNHEQSRRHKRAIARVSTSTTDESDSPESPSM